MIQLYNPIIDNDYQLWELKLDLQNDNESRDISKAQRLITETLFEGRNEIFIVHHDVEYRLRITKNDKLILTK